MRKRVNTLMIQLIWSEKTGNATRCNVLLLPDDTVLEIVAATGTVDLMKKMKPPIPTYLLPDVLYGPKKNGGLGDHHWDVQTQIQDVLNQPKDSD